MSADSDDTLVSLARQLLLVLAPLERGFSDADSFRALLYNLGLEATGLPAPYVDAAAEVAASVAVVEQMADGPFELSQVGALLGHATAISIRCRRCRRVSIPPPRSRSWARTSPTCC